jgi:ATP-dependent DNA helicase RecG
MNEPTAIPAWADIELSRDLLEIAAAGEHQNLEMKERFPVTTRDLAKEIAAFATSNTGIILLGVSDNGEIIGLRDCTTKDGRAQLIQRIEGICANVVKPTITPAFRFGDRQRSCCPGN